MTVFHMIDYYDYMEIHRALEKRLREFDHEPQGHHLPRQIPRQNCVKNPMT